MDNFGYVCMHCIGSAFGYASAVGLFVALPLGYFTYSSEKPLAAVPVTIQKTDRRFSNWDIWWLSQLFITSAAAFF